MLRCLPAAWIAGLLVLACIAPAEAKWVWTSDTGFVDTKDYETADPQELYEKAKGLYDAGKYSDAATEFARIALYSSEETFRERAGFMAGESLFQAGKYYKAYVALEDYLAYYPRTPRLKDVIKRQLDVGLKLLEGAKKDLLGMPILSGFSTGLEVMRKVLDKHPFEDFSDEYHFQLCARLEQADKHEDAALEWETFLQRYPSSDFAPTALFRKGDSQLKEFEGVDYDPKPLVNAKRTFEDYVQHNPHGDKVKEAEQRLLDIAEKAAEKDYNTAIFYLKDMDKPGSARMYLESLIADYPQTTWAQKARETLAKLDREGK